MRRWTMLGAAFVLGLAFTVSPDSTAGRRDLEGGFYVVLPEDVEWRSIPDLPGLSMAILAGNPSEPGPYAILGRFAPGVMTPPHRHDQDRHVVVLEGTWHAGTGPSFDRERTTPIPRGGFMKHPAGGVHYDGAKAETVVVHISGIGPVETEFLGGVFKLETEQ